MLVLMNGAKRSRTAQGVAAERAALAGMGVLDDPFSRGMLTPSMRAVLWAVEHGPHRVRTRSVTLAGLAAGIKQVAVLGAGYDSRAWRFRRGGVQFFELDHVATQQDKRRRAPRPGPVYVESDLTTDDAAKSLLDHGLDPSQPTFFVIEGVTMYLGAEDVSRQLVLLAKMSAVGSRIALDFYPPADVGTSQDHRQLRLQRLARTRSGESFRLALDRPQAVELVRASGWEVAEATSMRDAARTLVTRDSGLPVDAVNEHKTLVAAAQT
jgi:methyltransferase (TIGR00027 family)